MKTTIIMGVILIGFTVMFGHQAIKKKNAEIAELKDTNAKLQNALSSDTKALEFLEQVKDSYRSQRNDWIDYSAKLSAWGDRCRESVDDDPMRSFLERHKPVQPGSQPPNVPAITNVQIYIITPDKDFR